MKNSQEIEFNSSRVLTKKNRLFPPLVHSKRWNIKNVHGHQYVYKNKVFFMHKNAKLEAYEFNGNLLWSKKLREDEYRLMINEGMLLFENNLAICNLGENLIKINIDTGEINETYFAENFDFSNSVLTNGVFIYHSLTEDDLFCCNAYELSTNKFLWSIDLNDAPKYLAANEMFVIVVKNVGEIICKKIKTGETIWEYNNYKNPQILSIPQIYNNGVFLNFSNGKVIKLNITDGKVIWETTINSQPYNMSVTSDGNIYMVTYNNYTCLDIIEGKVIKEISMFDNFKNEKIYIPTQLCVSETHLYLGDVKTGKIIAIDKKNGNIDWSFLCESKIPLYNFIQIGDEKLFLVDLKGKLYVFNNIK